MAAGFAAGGAIAQEKKDDAHAGHAGHTGPNDRGKLTAGRRKPGEKPVPIETPDVPKLTRRVMEDIVSSGRRLLVQGAMGIHASNGLSGKVAAQRGPCRPRGDL